VTVMRVIAKLVPELHYAKYRTLCSSFGGEGCDVPNQFLMFLHVLKIDSRFTYRISLLC